jgi:hypothetical protein
MKIITTQFRAISNQAQSEDRWQPVCVAAINLTVWYEKE